MSNVELISQFAKPLQKNAHSIVRNDMTDLYAKCPCGSGKKIKFCCKDIIGDIERIERMISGEQRTAALDKISKLLEKHPDRPALLSMQAQVYLEMQQVDEAKAAADRLLEVEPDNSVALSINAILHAAHGELRPSLALLHRALRLSEGVITQAVYRAYLTVCMQLVQHEEYIAAYAHLLTMTSITKGQDRAVVSMLMQVTASEKLPAIFHGLMISDQCPENVTWQREFELAIDMYRQGDWTTAASMMDDMSSRILDEPILLRNQAILQVWTCQSKEAAKSFHYYAAVRDLDPLEAVEAESCAQVLEEVDPEDSIPLLAITQDIDDANAMMEKLLSADCADSLPVQRQPDVEAPLPKGQFVIFDRELPKPSQVDTTESSDDPKPAEMQPIAELPQEQFSITLFGKETDRNARMTLVAFKDDAFADAIKRVQELTGVAFELKEDEPLPVIGSVHKIERLFRPSFRVPERTTIDQFAAYQQEFVNHQLTEVWPTLTLSQFGGKSAKEVATERKFKRSVLASILNMEFWSDRQPFEFDFDALRTSLGLPATEPIDPTTLNVRTLTPTQLRAVQIEKVSDEDLKFIFEILSVRPNGRQLYRAAMEILKRPNMASLENMDLVEVHERLADLAPTSDAQLEHLGKARDLAVSEGESPASWLVRELDLRLTRGEPDAAKRIVTEIQSRYIREPGVAQMFAEVLSKYGLMPAGARPGAPPAAMGGGPPAALPVGAAAPAPEEAAGGVWTPDGGGGQAEGGEQSKLWVPGMD